MRLKWQTLTVLAATTALNLVAFVPPILAATLTYDLTFIDWQGTAIGTGEFSYDPDQVVVVRTPMPYSSAYVAGKDEPIRPDYIPPAPGLWQVTTYPNPLTHFVARLPGRDWNFSDLFLAWWNPAATSTLGSFGCSRAGCLVSNQWFAGSSTGLTPGQFAMFGGSPQSEDTYSGSFISAPLPSFPGSFTAGTWIATSRSHAVPEPTTVLGAIVFGAGWLLSTRRKLR